jgi:hypothetical protein
MTSHRRLLPFILVLLLAAFLLPMHNPVNAQSTSLCVTFSVYTDSVYTSSTGAATPVLVFRDCRTGELLLANIDNSFINCPDNQMNYDTGRCNVPTLQPDNSCYLLQNPVISVLNYPLFVFSNYDTQTLLTIPGQVSSISGFTPLASCQDCPVEVQLPVQPPQTSGSSTDTTVTIGEPIPPVPYSPGNGVFLQEGSTVTLSWLGQDAEYLLESDSNPYGGILYCNWQNQSSCSLGPLIAGTYLWHVKSRNSAGQESGWGESSMFIVQTGGLILVPPVYASEGLQVKACNFGCSVNMLLRKIWNGIWGRKPAPPIGKTTSAPPPSASLTFQSPVSGAGICIGAWGPGMGDHLNADQYAVDYIGPSGSPIYPTLGGTVVFSGYVSDGFGNVVAVRTDDLQKSGLYYYAIYAHLNDNGLPAVGETVTLTTILGTMGSSGTDNVHLHFAVRASPKQYMGAQALYGQRLNPREIFTPAFNVREKLNLTPLCGN